MQTSLKLLRTIQGAMLFSVGIYIFVALRYGPDAKPVPFPFLCAMALFGAFMAGAILLVRRVILMPAEMTLAGDSENSAGLSRWRFGYIAIFALSEAIALYGLILRFVGLGFQQVAPFFIAGVILMLYFGPRPPTNAIG